MSTRGKRNRNGGKKGVEEADTAPQTTTTKHLKSIAESEKDMGKLPQSENETEDANASASGSDIESPQHSASNGNASDSDDKSDEGDETVVTSGELKAIKAQLKELKELKRKLKESEQDKAKMQQLIASQEDTAHLTSAASVHTQATRQAPTFIAAKLPLCESIAVKKAIPKFLGKFEQYLRTCVAQGAPTAHWSQAFTARDLQTLKFENADFDETTTNEAFLKAMRDTNTTEESSRSLKLDLEKLTSPCANHEEFRAYSRSVMETLHDSTPVTRPSAQHLIMGFIARCQNEKLRLVLFRTRPSHSLSDGRTPEQVYGEVLHWMADRKQKVQMHFKKAKDNVSTEEKLAVALRAYRKDCGSKETTSLSAPQKDKKPLCKKCAKAGRRKHMRTHRTEDCLFDQHQMGFNPYPQHTVPQQQFQPQFQVPVPMPPVMTTTSGFPGSMGRGRGRGRGRGSGLQHTPAYPRGRGRGRG